MQASSLFTAQRLNWNKQIDLNHEQRELYWENLRNSEQSYKKKQGIY